VLSSVRLLKEIRAEYPARRIFVSSTTLAGRALAEEKLGQLSDGVFYAPVDYCFAIRSVLRRLRPSIVVVMETEIWPNWYREIKRTGAALLVANGRISDKAMPKYRRWRWFLEHVLQWPDTILAQSEDAAERYRALGAPAGRVRNAGNLKYDFDPDSASVPPEIRGVVERCKPEQIWIAASTMPPARPGDVDEDDEVIRTFGEVARGYPRSLLIQVPRRPGRFDVVAAKLEAAGVPFLRRSALTGEDELPVPGVLLLDSIGELSGLFPLADVVFMGGTLAERGGHNILEPAFYGKPVIVGPHMENFAAINAKFAAGDALVEIGAPGDLDAAVCDLFADRAKRDRIGSDAQGLAEAERGATGRVMDEIREMSRLVVPHSPMPLPLWLVLKPLSWLWAAGGAWKRSRAMASRRWLSTPVISIGGIGMGGAGKTPFTLHLAQRLKDHGRTPAILTRGYRRRVPAKSTVLEAGAAARVTITGDEAQLFLRAGTAHVGIGADRYATGKAVEERLHADVMLLDDGFQHWRLGRTVDFVLIDALDAFAGGDVFPAGRLREPLGALTRADAFLITRADSGSPLEGIRQRLREFNSEAPIFVSRVVPLAWVDAATGDRIPAKKLASLPAAAFCGLANPASFWRSLAAIGCKPAFCWTFGDHHHYSPREMKYMAADARAAGAEALLTTEKDLMNVPPQGIEAVEPLKLYWLQVGMAFEDEERLMEFVLARMAAQAAPVDPREASPRPPDREAIS
jgi:tetraacyldisaccharide 4'-kinase